jgi:methionine-rich copper-binding protein CopC
MSTYRRLMVSTGLAVVAAILMGGYAVAGERHLRLLKSEPANEAVIDAAPAAIELWFSEPPEVKVTTIHLRQPSGQTTRLEKVAADAEDATHIIAPVDSVTAAGAYSITWRTMSKDGHVVNGEIGFEVKPGT